ncbi:hypothetical protein OG559_02000 [Micromonospora sp. NBC_01405]|uniref:hypothetical protein n=1 Tax=Micromonospora sp. NBC_01405 TaxID=2903589 RepID=UPI003252462E
MITGYDTVLITGTPVDAGIRAMLDALHGRWPNMLVALGGEQLGPFLPWRKTRAQVPANAGEVYVARDAEMERRWDDVGYSSTSLIFPLPPAGSTSSSAADNARRRPDLPMSGHPILCTGSTHFVDVG